MKKFYTIEAQVPVRGNEEILSPKLKRHASADRPTPEYVKVTLGQIMPNGVTDVTYRPMITLRSSFESSSASWRESRQSLYDNGYTEENGHIQQVCERDKMSDLVAAVKVGDLSSLQIPFTDVRDIELIYVQRDKVSNYERPLPNQAQTIIELHELVGREFGALKSKDISAKIHSVADGVDAIFPQIELSIPVTKAPIVGKTARFLPDAVPPLKVTQVNSGILRASGPKP